MKLVLDTNIYSDYAAGQIDAVEIIATRGHHLCIPSVVLGELYYGFGKGSKKELNERKLLRFIELFNVEILVINEDVARKYVHIYFSLEKKGLRIPINDVWVAACCMNSGGTLFTRDSHFQYVDQIEKIILSDRS